MSNKKNNNKCWSVEWSIISTFTFIYELKLFHVEFVNLQTILGIVL